MPHLPFLLPEHPASSFQPNNAKLMIFFFALFLRKNFSNDFDIVEKPPSFKTIAYCQQIGSNWYQVFGTYHATLPYLNQGVGKIALSFQILLSLQMGDGCYTMDHGNRPSFMEFGTIVYMLCWQISEIGILSGTKFFCFARYLTDILK